MVNKETRKKIVNPKTGRKVLATGSVGKKIKNKPSKNVKKQSSNAKKKKISKSGQRKNTQKPKKKATTAKKNKSTSKNGMKRAPPKPKKKTTTKREKKPVKASRTQSKVNKSQHKKQTKKKTVKPSRKVQDSRNLANFINRIEGKKVMKVTKKGSVRLSAAQAFRDGTKLGTPHCYDGKCRYLREDKNKRKFWSTR